MKLYHSNIPFGQVVVKGNLEIINNCTGVPTHTFAENNLFKPLGITDYEWVKQGELSHSGGGLKLRPRDMAKFGLLFLNLGQWQGKRIISAQWVRKSTSKLASTGAQEGNYGYQWWRNSYQTSHKGTIESFAAKGYGGQFIFAANYYLLSFSINI